MKIALINGSPKGKNSASHTLLEDVKEYLGQRADVATYLCNTPVISQENIEKLVQADAWVFAYPLYVDGIPGHLLSCLSLLEQARIQKPQICVYGIVNCGFYEGEQADLALKILQNWCKKTGFAWGGGIGVGGGGGLDMMPRMESGKGPKAPIEKSMEELANAILKKKTRDNEYVSVAMPRFLYQMGAQMGWRQQIRANGGKVRDLRRKGS